MPKSYTISKVSRARIDLLFHNDHTGLQCRFIHCDFQFDVHRSILTRSPAENLGLLRFIVLRLLLLIVVELLIVIAAHLRLRQELLAGLILWGAGRLDGEGGLCQLCAPSRTVLVTHSVGTGRIAPASNHPAVLPSQDPTKSSFAGSSA